MSARLQADVLVVGGGMAAAMAALEAAKCGASVALIDKGVLGRSGSSPTAGGGMSAYWAPELGGHPEDSPEAFLRDTVVGGHYLNNQDTVNVLVEDAWRVIREVAELGVPFPRREDGRFRLDMKVMGDSYPRALVPIPGMGDVVMMALRKEVFHRGARVVEDHAVDRLLTHDGVISGAMALDRRSGRRLIVAAKAVVLAAGSATDLLPYSSANFLTTGDAYRLAYEAGAEMVNMEFQEFTVIPTPNGRPVRTGGSKPTTSAGARWHNALGERIMERYDPERMELAARATTVQANLLEREAGRGPVFMDLTHLAPEAMAKLEERDLDILRKLRAAGVDYRKDLIEWSPALHTFLGGLRIDVNGASTVPGLYGAGEAAGQGGVFGADRVGTALSACAVLGKRAGRSAAKFAGSRGRLPEAADPDAQRVSVESGADPVEVKREIQRLAGQYLNVVRNGPGLASAIGALAALGKEPLLSRTSGEHMAALDARSLALVGEMVARAALAREETRGQQVRQDFPYADNDAWLKWIVIRKGPDGMRLDVEDVPIERYSLRPRLGKEPYQLLSRATAESGDNFGGGRG